MTESPVAAVLFDFGGVFTESPFAAARAFAISAGVDPAVMLDTVFGPYDSDSDHPWHRLERGEILLGDARSEILRIGESRGFESDLFRVLAALGHSGGPRVEFLQRARELRARGIASAIVTNNVREFRDAWRSMIPIDELFDIVVDSCEVGVRKPDPRIFQKALELLGDIPASQAVFLDDYEGNVKAARSIGLHGIVVDPDPTEALARFDQLLGMKRA
ncbi:MAG: HAD family hydrolase [Candidatus Binatia bacterium]